MQRTMATLNLCERLGIELELREGLKENYGKWEGQSVKRLAVTTTMTTFAGQLIQLGIPQRRELAVAIASRTILVIEEISSATAAAMF